MLALSVKIPTMYSVYERSADFPRIPNILRITVRYSASHISADHALENSRKPYWQLTVINQRRELENDYGIPYLCNYVGTSIRKSKENLHKS